MSAGHSHSLGRRGLRTDITLQTSSAKRPHTKLLLIDTAERLFGQLGINAVSLREIGVVAGQTNSGVVQYHFEDKRGLLTAIINDRFHRLEADWRRRLATLAPDYNDPRKLLQILWEPMTSIQAADGSHPFCRFLLQYVLQPQGPEHPRVDLVAYRRSRKAPADFPCLAKVRRSLRRCYPQLPPLLYGARLSTVSMMFLCAVVEHDNAQLLQKEGKLPSFHIDFVLDLAIGAMNSPAK